MTKDEAAILLGARVACAEVTFRTDRDKKFYQVDTKRSSNEELALEVSWFPNVLDNNLRAIEPNPRYLVHVPILFLNLVTLTLGPDTSSSDVSWLNQAVPGLIVFCAEQEIDQK